MELLRELVEIKRDTYMSDLFEELGNLGKLELGPMVNAFKQTYSVYTRHTRGYRADNKETSAAGKKFSNQSMEIGKDSETVDGGGIKNWMGLKKVYKKFTDQRPIAAIFVVDKKPVALMIAAEWDLSSINDRVALAWDFSKVAPTKEESEALTKGLNTKGEHNAWREEVVGGQTKLGASTRTDIEKSKRYDHKAGEYEEKFTTKKYSGFTQTVREVVPFVNNLATAFGSRLEVRLILADKVRQAKRQERMTNRPIDPEDITLFKDSISKRLAKYKNSKLDSAEDAQDFVNKVFGGGLKKLQFAGSTYSVIPSKEYIGSSKNRHQGFYNGTMQDLMSGKSVTMQFEADRAESDFNTLYLTVKMVKGSLVPVEMRYQDKKKGTYGTSEKVKF